ncbi:MAG TPA: SUMF1/EgtB/PvdO family nonheme iron enzyme [Flavobacteriales bacterium]|nr:SUMF1/EgtB/PvdO family nonheme iron enzyme [Flavobacteriales bacterium]
MRLTRCILVGVFMQIFSPANSTYYSLSDFAFPVRMLEWRSIQYSTKFLLHTQQNDYKGVFPGWQKISPGLLKGKKERNFFPASMMYNYSPQFLDSLSPDGSIVLKRTSDTIDISRDYESFYCMKGEVTNSQFREFRDWVRDSVIRRVLSLKDPNVFLLQSRNEDGSRRLNWKVKVRFNDSLISNQIKDLYLPDHERYYRRKEFDYKKLQYIFQIGHEEKNVPVVPDSLSWVYDFQYMEYALLDGFWLNLMDPMVNMYFWHPEYDDYPVVGITFEQAAAYCQWKTKMMNNKLEKNGITVKVSIPTAVESDFVHLFLQSQTAHDPKYNLEEMFTDVPLSVYDVISFRDLAILQAHQFSDSIKLISPFVPNVIINRWLNPYWYNDCVFGGEFIRKNSSGKKESEKVENYYDNVSEWIDTDFSGLRVEVHERRRKMQLLYFLENSKNVSFTERAEGVFKGSKMIRGVNFLDVRNGSKDWLIPSHTFLSPDSVRSTVGFRCVMRVEEKKKSR